MPADAPAPVAEVAVLLPVRELFSYRVPEGLAGRVTVGCLVGVPVGRATARGVVTGLAAEPPEGVGTLREIVSVDDRPPFDRVFVDFVLWAARYYLAPPGELFRPAVREPTVVRPEQFVRAAADIEPGRLSKLQAAVLAAVTESGDCRLADLARRIPDARRVVRALESKGLVALESRLPTEPVSPPPPAEAAERRLTAGQQTAVDEIRAALDRGGFAPFLLHGVPASGKTEVYLRAAARALEAGRNVLVLVPEIALTPQLQQAFGARFGESVAVVHSGLSDRRRGTNWDRIVAGRTRIVLGARSAVFAPLASIGLVVVDEEHDPAYKDEERLFYNGRDLAVVRARLAGCPVVLGSATPSIESAHNAREGKYRLLRLPEKAVASDRPRITLVDLRRQPGRVLSRQAREAVSEARANGRTALVYLNRRGYANFMLCRSCGESVSCPNCSISLAFHKTGQQLLCHYCGHAEPVGQLCPACRALDLVPAGRGTERVEDELAGLFPDARIRRLDRDAVRSDDRLRAVLDEVREGRIDLLVGTAMVTKGHDFPAVSTVVVASADESLNFPDFRASERTFQIIAQVAGRAGRGAEAGRLVIQTWSPGNPVLERALRGDYDGFLEAELKVRAEMFYPPFVRLCLVRIEGSDEPAVERRASEAARLVREEFAPMLRTGRLMLLGPARRPLYRLKGRFRWMVLLKGRTARTVQTVGRRLQAAFAPRAGVRLAVDIDPRNFM